MIISCDKKSNTCYSIAQNFCPFVAHLKNRHPIY
nr:MAG TPA: hypothetical protein [Caudoviricetes sp.]